MDFRIATFNLFKDLLGGIPWVEALERKGLASWDGYMECNPSKFAGYIEMEGVADTIRLCCHSAIPGQNRELGVVELNEGQ